VRRGRLTTLSVARVPSRGHANRSTHAYRQTAAKLNRRTDDRRSLTLYGHTKTNHYTEIWWLVHWPLIGGLLHLVQ